MSGAGLLAAKCKAPPCLDNWTELDRVPAENLVSARGAE